MPMFGGKTPFPLRFGGGVPRLQRIIESLQVARGPMYSTSPTTAVGVENNALARTLDRDNYGANERMANSFSPYTTTAVTGMLPRWEAIFGITPNPSIPEPVRRATLIAAWQRIQGNNDAGGLSSIIASVLGLPLAPGSLLVAIVYTDPTSGGVSWWPANPNPSPDPNAPTPWWSTVANVAIQVQQPSNYTEAQFLTAINQAMATLDGVLPAWVTFNWFTVDTTAGVKGWYFDSYENFMRDVFSV
jgi:hypothetical protein